MSNSVDEVRRQIDTLDNRIHDLLMERADLVLKIGEEKRKNKIQVVQPEREAMMLRRLMARHKGPLPKEAVVRIWRELVGAVSLLQTGLKVIVTVPDDNNSALTYWDMAKDYFSSVLPMQKAGNPLAALAAVLEGDATFAVMPWPADGEANPWWSYLVNEGGDKPLRITGRLPLGNRTKAPVSTDQLALIVARLKVDSSGEDRSFIALDLEQGISRARVIEKAKALDMEALSLNSSVMRGGGLRTLHLLEVNRYVGEGDEILAKLIKSLESESGRAVALGSYPVFPVYDDKVGKGVEVENTLKAPASKKSA